jgi:hypothetical protein
MEILRDIVQHPVFAITSLAVGIVGVVLACLWRRRDKKPLWSITNNNLIRGFSKQLPNLDVKYSGQQVETLSISKIVFWNAGSETIRGDDIADADPLRVLPLNGVKLLDAKLVQDNSNASSFLVSTSSDMSAAFLQFDFIDKGQGAVIQVIHTGSSAEDICLQGTVKGGGAVKHKPLYEASFFDYILRVLVPMVILLGSIIAAGYYIRQFGFAVWLQILIMISVMVVGLFLFSRVASWKLNDIRKELRSHFRVIRVLVTAR